MKLTTVTQVSVDGVMQGNGGRDESLDPGFERGGWARPPTPLFDDEAMTFVNEVYQRADAFLFGRRTYERFAGYWGVQSGNPIADALNARPKYVASRTLTESQWADTTVLSGDLATAIGELKARLAGELQVHGSGVLVRWLLEQDLVDEINLLICPVVVGQGTRLFPDSGRDVALDLVQSRAFPRGVTSQVYGDMSSTAEVEAGQRYLADIVRSLQTESIEVETEVIHSSNPKNEIVRYATRVKPDLLIMGAHGHKRLKDLIFGNTIDPVRHALNVPILVVRG